MSVLILLITLSFGFASGPECSAAPFKMWVQVETAYYFTNLIFVYLYYRELKTRGRENMRYLAVNCGLNLLHTCWLIYGNVILWPNYDTC